MTARFTAHSADLFYSWCVREFPSLTWTILDGPAVSWSRATTIYGVLYGLPTDLTNEEWEPIIRSLIGAYV